LSTIIGYDYRKTIRYKVDNDVGKMTKEIYTRDILPHVLDLKDRGITLCQDADSVYTSKLTQEWVEEHGFSMMTLPGKSPDFSILESMAASLKRRFHYRRVTTEEAALQRFEHIFHDLMNQEVIQNMYDKYTARLKECQDRDGQMTRY
jgi:transposase InsO family protein